MPTVPPCAPTRFGPVPRRRECGRRSSWSCDIPGTRRARARFPGWVPRVFPEGEVPRRKVFDRGSTGIFPPIARRKDRSRRWRIPNTATSWIFAFKEGTAREGRAPVQFRSILETDPSKWNRLRRSGACRGEGEDSVAFPPPGQKAQAGHKQEHGLRFGNHLHVVEVEVVLGASVVPVPVL